ncbi:MAG: DUF5615 family PIN-like protein [Deltaproteobacteria bacterium]|nr:DUF5615 family PIN-like protein [Deltaproteobacteria bacterium]
MTIAFLIDECLSPELSQQAHEAGFASTSMRDRGWAGLLDHEVVRKALDHDLVLVTRNARDFRGDPESGEGGLLRRVAVHPGLICLDSERDEGFDVAKQRELFAAALDEVQRVGDLVNLVVDVLEELNGDLRIDLYDMP